MLISYVRHKVCVCVHFYLYASTFKRQIVSLLSCYIEGEHIGLPLAAIYKYAPFFDAYKRTAISFQAAFALRRSNRFQLYI